MGDEAAEEMFVAYKDAREQHEVVVPDSSTTASDAEKQITESIPYIEVEGEKCIGEITMPAIGITLPVLRDCTTSGLKKAPCRYVGSAKENSMVIAAHNYKRQFGKISHLKPGDTVTFTDVEDNVYRYEVQTTETLGAYDVEKMIAGDWDLTLFTCTYGGQKRVTVRCSLVES